MTFVLKKFADADKPKYDEFHFINRLNTFRYPDEWVVDEERDAVFVVFGGQGYRPPEHCEPPTFYALAWQGLVVELESFYRTTFPAKYHEVIWHRMEMRAPHELENKLDTVSEMVREALLAYQSIRKYPAEAVNVEFVKISFK